jgi:hypothetical protein
MPQLLSKYQRQALQSARLELCFRRAAANRQNNTNLFNDLARERPDLCEVDGYFTTETFDLALDSFRLLTAVCICHAEGVDYERYLREFNCICPCRDALNPHRDASGVMHLKYPLWLEDFVDDLPDAQYSYFKSTFMKKNDFLEYLHVAYSDSYIKRAIRCFLSVPIPQSADLPTPTIAPANRVSMLLNTLQSCYAASSQKLHTPLINYEDHNRGTSPPSLSCEESEADDVSILTDGDLQDLSAITTLKLSPDGEIVLKFTDLSVQIVTRDVDDSSDRASHPLDSDRPDLNDSVDKAPSMCGSGSDTCMQDLTDYYGDIFDPEWTNGHLTGEHSDPDCEPAGYDPPDTLCHAYSDDDYSDDYSSSEDSSY